jgi:hypothetical protein
MTAAAKGHPDLERFASAGSDKLPACPLVLADKLAACRYQRMQTTLGGDSEARSSPGSGTVAKTGTGPAIFEVLSLFLQPFLNPWAKEGTPA